MRLRRLVPLLFTACVPTLPAVDVGMHTNVSYAHAHNDYEHTRPLLDALDAKFDSVEADVWWTGADLGVSHSGPPFKGTLRELYLNPLMERVQRMGSVYGDGKPFFLWLDFKDAAPALDDELVKQLDAVASMLTTFDDAGVMQAGAVTVVLTGGTPKVRLTARPAPRRLIRDSNDYSANDPQADGAWGYYAVNYFSFLQWSGMGDIPTAQRRQLENLVDGVHAKGRKLRIYGSPDTPGFWKAARAAGVDFVNADDLSGLRAVLDTPP